MGFLTMAIGLLHTASAPMIHRRWMQILPQDTDRVLGVVFFFVVAGLAVLFTGLLMTYASSGIERTETWARSIGLYASLFVILFGIGAIAVGMSNQLIWLLVFGGVSNMIVLLLNRKRATGTSPQSMAS
jgi:hypothetical protein